MSWDGAIDRIGVHLDAARAAVNATYGDRDPFSATHLGEPFGALTKQVAYWYDGDQESTTGGNTLGQQNVEEKLTIRWYVPVLNRSDGTWRGETERILRACNRETQTRLMGDAHLQQSDVIGLSTPGGTAGWQQVGEAWIRVLTIPLFVDMPWVAAIAI